MAKTSVLDEPAGMDKADIKRHLRMAREEAVSVAFAVGRDGKAILQFDRRKQGRALEKQLKDAAPDSKNHRWGTALIDPDDAKTVCFTVNKGGGGLAKKLIVALKGTGFNKVKLQLEDGSEVEVHEEQDEGGQEDADSRPAASAAAGAGLGQDEALSAGVAAGAAAGVAAGAGAAAAAEARPAVSPQAGQPDAAALEKELTGLVKRMLGVIARDPAQKAALTELAVDAQASLRRGDLEQAGAGIDIFREAIKDGEAATAGRGTAQQGLPNGAATNGAAKTNGAAPAHAATKSATPPAPDLRKEAEELLKTLTRVVKDAMPMLSAVPGLGELIKAVVPAVQAAVKAGQHDEARLGIQKVLDAISGAQKAGAGASQSAGGPVPEHQHREHAAKHAPTIEKAGQVWKATRQWITTELESLEKKFTSALDGHGMMGDLTKTLRTKVEGSMGQLDDGLVHALAAINGAPDAAERAKHVERAHKLIQQHQAHVGSDKTIKMLDRNPFHPLDIEKTVLARLAVLQKSIH